MGGKCTGHDNFDGLRSCIDRSDIDDLLHIAIIDKSKKKTKSAMCAFTYM